jgi:hypothetical protein
VNWQRRIIGWKQNSASDLTTEAAGPEHPERGSPGLAAFFDKVGEDRTHAVLDLGAASETSLHVYGRYARWVRFAGLLSPSSLTENWMGAAESIPPNPDRPYDLLVVWDILDRLLPEERPALVKRLAEVSAPDARLFMIVGSSDGRARPLRQFSLVTPGTMRYAETSVIHSVESPLLPADVQRVLVPFEVSRAFSSDIGIREYVAIRRSGAYRPT